MTGAAPETARILLGPDGVVYQWREGMSQIVPARLAGLQPVVDLAILEPGRRLVVVGAVPTSTSASGRRRWDGVLEIHEARDDAAPPAATARRVTFEGTGLHVAVSPDHRAAYVIAYAGSRGAAGGGATAGAGAFWLHAVDLESARLSGSVPLPYPPQGIAVGYGGARVCVAVQDRLLSYTTRPLAASWHYLSPGANQGLAFAPDSDVLYAARGPAMVVFDPGRIAARREEDRRSRDDDATAAVALPFEAMALSLEADGDVVAVRGDARLALVDRASLALLAVAPPEEDARIQALRSLRVAVEAGEWLIASFPTRQVVQVGVDPPPPAPAPAPAAPAPAEVAPAPAPSAVPPVQDAPSASPSVAPAPAPAPAAAPAPPEPAVSVTAEGLGGRLMGRVELVGAIVLYGPDSIVREARRIRPRDRVWETSLPAAGVYRVVPVGADARLLRCEPNFITVDTSQGPRGDLDFKILGAG